ncbi:hypothetical protein BD324DRAFT_652808 [Kockovaella imperatae]|uniref:Uncharacterized protein n=1 Tax=Kockovaella imperatae TaxID=4999 RepID=A0A1Y1UAR5_9TREE|nr:hypothetical protein BD324DRAFT_652808 [Kockovaella imperatae]ORX35092.1 hypothetical protein BD324DRAFT_652808 [Kockovaella imperatae]
MTDPTLYILYNASGTLLGHAAYAYAHMRCDTDKSCSACTLTHGPKLSLSERKEWKELKGKLTSGEFIPGQRYNVKQWHTEEQDNTVKQHLEAEKLRLPCILLQRPGESMSTVFTRAELDEFAGVQDKFEAALRKRI